MQQLHVKNQPCDQLLFACLAWIGQSAILSELSSLESKPIDFSLILELFFCTNQLLLLMKNIKNAGNFLNKHVEYFLFFTFNQNK